MIINEIDVRSHSHLPHAHADGVDMSPPALRVLEVGLRWEMKKIEVEAEMALEAVIMEMKFWDNIFNLPQ